VNHYSFGKKVYIFLIRLSYFRNLDFNNFLLYLLMQFATKFIYVKISKNPCLADVTFKNV
jgi:hypothetical protein